jgi:hypothetical protein
MLDLVEDHAAAGRAVLEQLDDPDIDKQCGSIRAAVIEGP